MVKIKKVISAILPVESCNLNCSYCFLDDSKLKHGDIIGIPKFTYDINLLRQALSTERMGGTCLINICGEGETMIPEEIIPITTIMLENGHYVFLVTNGTITKRFDQMEEFPAELRDRLGFKFSFHYSELKRTGQLDTFYNNLNKMRECGCSVTLELVPNDELNDEINEIIESCHLNTGALCHVSMPRKESDKHRAILTALPEDEFINIWSAFNSGLLEVKKKLYGIKRREFCYAGDWAFVLNLGNGDIKQCYRANYKTNIFKNIKKPLNKLAIGNNCEESYCWCGNVFLALGCIPELDLPSYESIRNRVCSDGSEWLNKDMKDFLSGKLYDDNSEYSRLERTWCNILNKALNYRKRLKKLLRRNLSRVKHWVR